VSCWAEPTWIVAKLLWTATAPDGVLSRSVKTRVCRSDAGRSEGVEVGLGGDSVEISLSGEVGGDHGRRPDDERDAGGSGSTPRTFSRNFRRKVPVGWLVLPGWHKGASLRIENRAEFLGALITDGVD